MVSVHKKEALCPNGTATERSQEMTRPWTLVFIGLAYIAALSWFCWMVPKEKTREYAVKPDVVECIGNALEKRSTRY
jgi:hypothetical protein